VGQQASVGLHRRDGTVVSSFMDFYSSLTAFYYVDVLYLLYSRYTNRFKKKKKRRDGTGAAALAAATTSERMSWVSRIEMG
jgi:hypothetical protein